MVDFLSIICLGASGFSCSGVWLVMGALFLATAVFRKVIANEMLGVNFNLLTAAVLGEIAFAIIFFLTKNIGYGLLAGVVGMMLGGFLFGNFLGMGESSGDSEISAGSYDE